MSRISLLILILSVTYPLQAQESPSSAEVYSGFDYKTIRGYQIEYLKKFYFQNVDNIDELVNGKDYIPYYFRSKYKPLLYSDKKDQSSLLLSGRRYDNLTLEYDTFKDELIYSDSLKFIDNKVFKISLNKDPVDGFIFYSGNDSLSFRYFSNEEEPGFNLPEGFYEVGYEGRSKFIIKHRSYLLVKDGIDEYIYSPANYVMVNDGYAKITSKRVFLKLFGDEYGEMKKFMRTNKVHIRKADRNEIATVLKYYDSLISSNREVK